MSKFFHPSSTISFLIALLTLVPLMVMFSAWWEIDATIWAHLSDYVLPNLLSNTFFLMLGVSVGVLTLGISLAWCVAIYDFPLRKFFNWSLMLPLSIPAYVMAFSQQAQLSYSAPLPTFWREYLNFLPPLPPLTGTLGVSIVLSLAFYPYVYLLAKQAFSNMGLRSIEVGQSLNLSVTASFWRVALPMARPWILGGLTLALMETLADFGTVSIFNYDTFTSAIYKSWFSLFSLNTAKQLAAILVLFIFVLISTEQHLIRHRRYHHRHLQHQFRQRLTGLRAGLVFVWASSVLCLAFIVPLAQLIFWAYATWDDFADSHLWSSLLQSFTLASFAAVLTVSLAFILVMLKQYRPNAGTAFFTRLATMGYAIPGTVLAVGIFVPLAWMDHQILTHATLFFPNLTIQNYALNGSIVALLLALATRFLAIAHTPKHNAIKRLSPHLGEAASLLGKSFKTQMRLIYFPLLKGSTATALIMVFVECLKEIPIVLMMRPYDWDILAVRIFNLTTEGQWEAAAIPSLIIVCAGLLPVVWLSRHQ
jgi:iron(III) transport system permease protein